MLNLNNFHYGRCYEFNVTGEENDHHKSLCSCQLSLRESHGAFTAVGDFTSSYRALVLRATVSCRVKYETPSRKGRDRSTCSLLLFFK